MQRVQAQRCHINGILAHRERSTGTTAAARKIVQQTIDWQLCLLSDLELDFPQHIQTLGPVNDGDNDDDDDIVRKVGGGRKDDEGDDRSVWRAFKKLGFLSQDLEGHAIVKTLHLCLSRSETEMTEGM